MNAAEHAERILNSWEKTDSCFQDELLYALATCRASESASSIESERREVLQSAVEQLRSLRGLKAGRFAQAAAASLALLRHLRHQPRSKAAAAC
jgi:hypothetical protein